MIANMFCMPFNSNDYSDADIDEISETAKVSTWQAFLHDIFSSDTVDENNNFTNLKHKNSTNPTVNAVNDEISSDNVNDRKRYEHYLNYYFYPSYWTDYKPVKKPIKRPTASKPTKKPQKPHKPTKPTWIYAPSYPAWYVNATFPALTKTNQQEFKNQ